MLAVKQTENQCDRKLDRLVSGCMGRLAYSHSIRQGGGLSEGGCQLNRLSDRQVERLSCRQVKTLTDTQVAMQVSSCLKAGCRTGVLYKMACMGMCSSLYIFLLFDSIVTVHGKSVENAYLF
jgi:hypothetical protein